MPQNLPSSMQFVDIPVFNMLIPKEGPKAVPINFDFTGGQQSMSVDLSLLQQRKYISQLQSVFIDNSQNTATFSLAVNGSSQTIVARPKSQGFYTIMAPNPPKFVGSSGGGVIVPVVFINVPIPTQVWDATQIAGKFDGTGNLLVDEPVLEACVTNNALNTVLNANENNNVVKPFFAADELFSGSGATAGANVVVTGNPSYFITGIDISLTGDATTGVAQEYTVTVKDGANTLFVKTVNLPAAAGTGNLIPVMHYENLQFNSKSNAAQLTITGGTALSTGKLQWTFAGGLCAQIGP